MYQFLRSKYVNFAMIFTTTLNETKIESLCKGYRLTSYLKEIYHFHHNVSSVITYNLMAHQ